MDSTLPQKTSGAPSRARAACLYPEDTPRNRYKCMTPGHGVLFQPFATWAHVYGEHCGRFRPLPHPPRTLIRAKISSTRTYARIRAIPPSHRGRILTGKPYENRGNPGVLWHPRDSPDCSRIVYRQPQPGTGFSYRLSEGVVRDNVMVANSFLQPNPPTKVASRDKFTTSIAPSRRLPPTDNVLNFTS